MKTLAVSCLFVSSLSFASIEIDENYTLYFPETNERIEKAIGDGLLITLQGVRVDPETNISYGLLNNNDANIYCLYDGKINMTVSFHDEAYTKLLLKNESVLDYGWPLGGLSISERISSYSDGGGDMVSGLRGSQSLEAGLVVCRNSL